MMMIMMMMMMMIIIINNIIIKVEGKEAGREDFSFKVSSFCIQDPRCCYHVCVYMGHSPENWTEEDATFPMK